MSRSIVSSYKVALVWRGDPEARETARPETSRLRAIFDAFARLGVSAEPAVYAEETADRVRDQLLGMDGVLVWVDPVSGGLRRGRLNALLREVAARGVFVSAHPDVIDKIGVKAVLHATRGLGWGSDVAFYATPAAFQAGFPARLRQGAPRVLKQNRSNGGQGVWKVTPSPSDTVEVLSAQGGDPPRRLALGAFIAEQSVDLEVVGGLVDQPFQARHLDGMVRCYMSGERVAGFGHQLVRALADREEGPAGPRLYSGPDDPRFQVLRDLMEREWTPGMARLLDLELDWLPVIWDADFLLGPKGEDGRDSYVLCEINASSVFPIPDEAADHLAETTLRRLDRRPGLASLRLGAQDAPGS